MTHVSAGWDPPEPEVPRCPRRWNLPSPGCPGVPAARPGWVRVPGPAPLWAPAAPAPQPRTGARALGLAWGRAGPESGGRRAGTRGRGALPWGGAGLRQLPGKSSPGSTGAAAPAQPPRPPLRSFRRRREGARGSRRGGGAAGVTAVPAPAGHRAARSSYLPAPSRVCAGPLSPGGGCDQRRSMAAAVPPARALCPRLRLGPRPPAAMPGARSGRAQPPPPERGAAAAAALSPIESGARRAPSRLACPGGLPAQRSERSPAAPSPTEAAAAK